ncbi:MAG: hypothetical protein H0T42_06435 [Deltaproteobacteria bacterium]|nr:hypothetical protein [Deltaproteobacteria bacterium]
MRSLVLVLAVAACGDNLHPTIDARPIDSAPADAPVDGPCAVGRHVTGELLDLDSTSAALAGINNAVFTQRGGTATDTTSPNGRFEMCASSTTSYLFDVDAPATHVDAIAYFEVGALSSLYPIGFRTWTPARGATFFTSRGLTYDATKAHVLVYMAGDRTQLTLSGGSHGAVQAANDEGSPGTFTWQAGAGGRYILFPNVDPTAGMVTLIGDYMGDHVVPVEAGKITFAAISIVFL